VRLTTRHLIRGTGQHRKPAPAPAPGAVVAQQFVRCGRCGGIESAATRHGDVIRCAEGHVVPEVEA
jgi:hypothetical protein